MMALDARRVLIPLGILIALLLALLVMFERSYQHLSEVGLHISRIQDRQRLLAQISSAVNQAEAAQRDYLLSADLAQLSDIGALQSRVNAYLRALEDSYRHGDAASTAERPGRAADARSQVDPLKTLIALRLQQVDHSLAIHRDSGREAALAYALEGPGRHTMGQLREDLKRREAREADDYVETWSRYLERLRSTRMAIAVATLVNLLLLAGVGVLLWRALQRRSNEALNLQQQVAERTAELAALSSHLQDVSEREKQQLARELHDALGGLLIATKMDLAWLRSRLPTEDPQMLLRWRRIQQSLDHGVDFKRRVVEQLRPTLLDNMGLFTALRWQLQEICNSAGLRCVESMPDTELQLTNEAAIALFRTAQEALTNVLKHSGATAVDFTVRVDAANLTLIIGDNGRGIDAGQKAGGQGLAGMRHRIQALGASLQVRQREEGGTEVWVQAPLSRIVQPPT